MAIQAASAPSTPALSASWRPLEPSSVGAEHRGGAAGDDSDDVAEAVSARAAGAAYPDEDAPRWPDENDEADMLANIPEPTTIRAQIDHAAATAEAERAESVRDLPELEDLIQRIPVGVRDGLEELFRAKYTKVLRLPKRVFSRPQDDN